MQRFPTPSPMVIRVAAPRRCLSLPVFACRIDACTQRNKVAENSTVVYRSAVHRELDELREILGQHNAELAVLDNSAAQTQSEIREATSKKNKLDGSLLEVSGDRKGMDIDLSKVGAHLPLPIAPTHQGSRADFQSAGFCWCLPCAQRT